MPLLPHRRWLCGSPVIFQIRSQATFLILILYPSSFFLLSEPEPFLHCALLHPDSMTDTSGTSTMNSDSSPVKRRLEAVHNIGGSDSRRKRVRMGAHCQQYPSLIFIYLVIYSIQRRPRRRPQCRAPARSWMSAFRDR